MDDKILNSLIKFFILMCVIMLIFTVHLCFWNKPKEITRTINEEVMNELSRRAVGDCILEPHPKGWVCTDKKGRKYVIKKSKDE